MRPRWGQSGEVRLAKARRSPKAVSSTISRAVCCDEERSCQAPAMQRRPQLYSFSMLHSDGYSSQSAPNLRGAFENSNLDLDARLQDKDPIWPCTLIRVAMAEAAGGCLVPLLRSGTVLTIGINSGNSDSCELKKVNIVF